MKIKLCGIRRREDVEIVNRLKPDYIGFIFYQKSKRYVTPEQAYALRQCLNRDIKVVGVFVNAEEKFIEDFCQKNIIDVIQLHGNEDTAYMMRIKQATGKMIIKAVRVKNAEEIIKAQEYPSDFLLLDTYRENEYGGSGIAFDHNIIPILNKPYFLAGGINLDNMEQAAKRCSPYAFDVSSGCETDGAKDERKCESIIALARKL